MHKNRVKWRIVEWKKGRKTHEFTIKLGGIFALKRGKKVDGEKSGWRS